MGATWRVIVSGSLAVGAAIPALADEAVPADTIVVTGERVGDVPGGQVARGAAFGAFGERDLFDTAVSTKSFTEDYIANQTLFSATELASRDASFTITSAEILNGGGAGRLRGFRLEPFESSYDGFATVATRRYPLEMVSRVDILKGPTAVFTGVIGGVGGTLNYVSKKPLDAPLTRLSGLYASQGQFGGQADVSRRFGTDGRFGVRANLAFRDGEAAIDSLQETNKVAHLALDWRGERATLGLQYGYFDLRIDEAVSGYFVPAGVPVPRAPRGSKVGGPRWDNRNVSDEFIRAALDIELAGGWTAFAVAGLNRSEELFIGLIPALVDGAGNADAFTFAQQGNVRWGDGYNLDAGVRGRFTTGPINHAITLAYGLVRSKPRYSDLAIDPGYVQPRFNIYDPASYEGPAPGLVGTGTFFPNLDEKTQGLVIADEVTLIDGRLRVTAGVRHTRLAFDSFNYGAPSPDGPISSYRANDWSPAFAVLAKPSKRISIYANYLKAVERGSVAPLEAINRGAIIAPGVSRQYEAGLKADLGGFGVTAAVFDIVRPSTFIDPDTRIFGQFGRARHRGLELDLFGEPVRGLRLLASYAYLDAQIRDADDPALIGNVPVSVPENVLVLNIDADVPGVPGLAAVANLRHVGRQFLEQANLRSIPGFTTFDAGLRYGFEVRGTPLKARLNVTNLFDKNYFQSTDFTLQTGQPRTVRLTLTADL